MPGTSFLRELKRRHVYRVSAAYAVVGWLLIEIATQVFPVFHMPDWAAQLVVLLIVIGFPFVVLLAWAFEVTPEGVRRTEPVHSPDVRKTDQTYRVGRYLNAIIIIVLALGVGALLWRRYAPHAAPAVPAAANVAATSAVAASAATSARSVAVMPFENLSADKANAYFADGIQDEILTGLAKIGGLKVISRTSTKGYASQPDNVAEIARQLDVATILEGSVQKVGEYVRVNVQLIDARSDSHVWAETYDRTLDDIFAVESEVAQKIADSLHAALTHDERAAIASKPTNNPQAYEAYLKARSLMLRSTFDRDNIQRIIAVLRQAVKLDPQFALAWAELAQQHVWMYWEGFDPTPARLAEATDALQRAAQLAPDLPQVELARGMYLYYGQRKFADALAAIRRAQRGLPNDAWVWYAGALLERRLGQWDSALEDFQRARSLSPNDLSIVTNYAITISSTRRFGDAVKLADAGLMLKPDDPSLLALKVFCLRNLGDSAAADRVLAMIKPDSLQGIVGRARQALYSRDYAAASAFFAHAVTVAGDTQAASSFNGYIAAAIDYQLQRALSEARAGSAAAAAEIYRQVQVSVSAALADNPTSPNVKAALHSALGMAYAGLGQRDRAVAEGQRAIALIPVSADAAEGPGWQENLARIQALDGDATHAVPLIEDLLQTSYLHPLAPGLMKLDPTWDPIRKDAHFQALLHKYAGNRLEATSSAPVSGL